MPDKKLGRIALETRPALDNVLIFPGTNPAKKQAIPVIITELAIPFEGNRTARTRWFVEPAVDVDNEATPYWLFSSPSRGEAVRWCALNNCEIVIEGVPL
jgi:hypothetical protein